MASLRILALGARLAGGLGLKRVALRCPERNLIWASNHAVTGSMAAGAPKFRTWALPASDNSNGWWSSCRGLSAGLGLLAVGGGMCSHAGPVRCDEVKEEEPPAKSEPSLLAKCCAEAVGTGIIVHGGCGVVCTTKYANAGMNVFQMAGIWGLSIAIAIFATREISGAHLNPAVSFSLAANKGFSWSDLGPYVMAQCVGATIAGGLNYLIHHAGIAAFEAKDKLARGTTTATINGAFGMYPNAALVSPIGAFLAEIWMTALFVFMIFAITDGDGTVPKDAAPLLIGGAAATMIAIYGPITGCGMNPARDLGPRLITAYVGFQNVAWTSAWIYTLGPILGAIIGGAFYQAFYAEKK